ncbi:MAG: hypothetical protein M3Y49_02830 [Actinomycetota bacterium]|nr:hypothetical protein [Actinomycetota bacterium]
MIIVPVLERTLGPLSLLGAAGVCAVAWVVGTSVRHCVRVVEPALAARSTDKAPDKLNMQLDRAGDAVIVVAYVISVALYLRIMAQYVVGYLDPGGSALWERSVACVAVAVIVLVGVTRRFASAGARWIVITVQGFETVQYLGDRFDAETRVRASRLAQLVAASIYLGFVAVATPVMGLGTAAGPDNTLLDITGRVAPWLALPLVLSAVLSQFSAAVADTVAAQGNLSGLSRFMRGPTPYLVSGGATVLLAATTPTFTIVAVASRAFAAYHAIQAVMAMRTSVGVMRRAGYFALAAVVIAIALVAESTG